jgi:hypothetical protein
VINENLIAGAIPQSNLGGGRTLGLDGDYGTTYSSYYTVNESYTVAGQQIFRGLGCNQTSIAAQIACLKTVDSHLIQNHTTVARYVVQDGSIVNTEQLIVSERNSSTAHVPVIFGTTTNDGELLHTDQTNILRRLLTQSQVHHSPTSHQQTSQVSPKEFKPVSASPLNTLSSPSTVVSSHTTTAATCRSTPST